MSALAVGALALSASATGLAGVAAASSAPPDSWRYSVNRVLKDARIRESSGLARSTYARSVVFTHNDSGDGPRFFAVGRHGRTQAIFTLKGATHRDWEDISSGPGHTLWLGDIGDNSRSRSFISVYRVKEPKRLASRNVSFTRYDLKYPDGPHNAESLMVRPGTGRVFVVSKDAAGGHVYRAPAKLSTKRYNRLTKVGSGPVLATAAAWFPGGHNYVVRTHNWADVYHSIGGRPSRIRLPYERQGEAIDVSRNGRYFLTDSEGVHTPVHEVRLGAKPK